MTGIHERCKYTPNKSCRLLYLPPEVHAKTCREDNAYYREDGHPIRNSLQSSRVSELAARAPLAVDSQLPLKKIDWLREVGDANVFSKGWVLALQRQKHLPRNTAIAEVAGRTGAQFGNVLGLGEVHLEE